jgi:hypothetical protein
MKRQVFFEELGRSLAFKHIKQVFGKLCTELRWDDEYACFVVINSSAFRDGVPTPCAVAVTVTGLEELQNAGDAVWDLFESRVANACRTMELSMARMTMPTVAVA